MLDNLKKFTSDFDKGPKASELISFNQDNPALQKSQKEIIPELYKVDEIINKTIQIDKEWNEKFSEESKSIRS